MIFLFRIPRTNYQLPIPNGCSAPSKGMHLTNKQKRDHQPHGQ